MRDYKEYAGDDPQRGETTMPKLITKLDPITITSPRHRVHMKRVRLMGRRRFDAKIPRTLAFQALAIRAHQVAAANVVAAFEGRELEPVEKVEDTDLPDAELDAIVAFLVAHVTRIDDGTDDDDTAITDRGQIEEYFEYSSIDARLEVMGMARLQMAVLDKGTTLTATRKTAKDREEAERAAVKEAEEAAETAAPDPETGG